MPHSASLLALLLLCAAVAGRPAPAPAVGLNVPDHVEPGGHLSAQLTVANDGAAPVRWKVTYSLQAASAVYDAAPPDPDFGVDIAQGARSWAEWGGERHEDGSLTDGKDYTDGSTPWDNRGFTEAFQFIDLGKPRRIVHLAYLSGDANHAWKLDIAVSTDGQSYTPVAELQGVDEHQKWGVRPLNLRQPVVARFIRLRHHHDGAKEPVLRFPCRFSVYTGVDSVHWALPRVGEEIERGTATVEAAPSRGATVSLTFARPLSPGLYLLSALFEGGGRHELTYRHVLVPPPPMPKRTPASRFGINAARGEWAPVLGRLGVGWVRFENLKWPFVTPRPGAYAFDGTVKPWGVNVDEILAGYEKQGISVLPFLFMLTPEASSAPAGVKEERKAFYPPKDPALFAEFCFQVAARYGARRHPDDLLKTADRKSGLGLLHTYEIWNEPNLTDPGWGPWVGSIGQYFDLLRASSQAVKRADPAAKVANGGWAGITLKTVDQLRTHTYADGTHPLDYIDIVNVHMYTGRIPPEVARDDFNANQTSDATVEDDLRQLVAWRDRWRPGMPIWLTETGYDSAGPYGTDERTQAARLPRVVLIALASGMDKVFVYRESGSTASMHAASGLLRDDGSMKPSYLSYATLIRELDGVTGGARRLHDPDPNVRLYAWKRGGETILTAWTIEGAGHVALDLGHATVTDAFGRRARRDLSRGLDLGEFPIYIRDIEKPAAIETRAREAGAAAGSGVRP